MDVSIIGPPFVVIQEKAGHYCESDSKSLYGP